MPVPGHGASRVLYRLVSLEQAATERERLVSSLAREELLRGNRLIDRGKAELFLLGRGVLRQTLATLRSRFRSPASRVYWDTMLSIASLVMSMFWSFSPFSVICFGTRYLRAMNCFSSSVYPAS